MRHLLLFLCALVLAFTVGCGGCGGEKDKGRNKDQDRPRTTDSN